MLPEQVRPARLNSGYCFLSSPTTCPSPHQKPLPPFVIVYTLITDTVLPFGRSLTLKVSSDSPLLHIHLVPRWCGCPLRGAPGPARLSPAHGAPSGPVSAVVGFLSRLLLLPAPTSAASLQDASCLLTAGERALPPPPPDEGPSGGPSRGGGSHPGTARAVL